jgi:branched-chain amino acid transport system substrate-binding protein
MKRSRSFSLLAVLAALVLLVGACSSRDDDDGDGGNGGNGNGNGNGEESSIDTSDCGSDPTAEIEGDTIKLVSSYPQSGLTGAFSEIARGWTAYFEMVNEEGGVDIAGKKYQIEYEDKDDEYNPENTATNIRELVGEDGESAFATFSVVGTANNINIRDFLKDLCVPDLFAATGAVTWGNTDEYPFLSGSTLVPYTLEAQAFAAYLKEENPTAKVAMLRQNDEFGETYEQGFRTAIEGSDIELVAVEEYAPDADNVTTQVTSLAGSGADAFFNGATLLNCPNALTAKQDQNWDATTWVSGTCISKTLMGIAGAAGDGVISLTNLKDPLNPKYEEDPDMVAFFEGVQKYQGGDFKGRPLDLENAIIAYGWTQAEVLVHALEQAEAPTRLAVMEAVRSIDGYEAALMIDGVSATTAPDDPFMGESFILVEYDGEAAHFNEIGELQDFEGKTADVTPEDLINA